MSSDESLLMTNMRAIFSTAAKLLAFKISQAELHTLGANHFLLGLACTWIVGIGRYWDDPGANLLQHLGFGSVIYIFVLAWFIWLIIWPLRPKEWSYAKVVTFVSLTSPPAILYAMPVERFMSIGAARSLNAWFLAVVATWRVALLVLFLRRYAQLGAIQTVVASCLPLTLIVTVLTALNLERAVFDIMGGLREGEGTANDSAYAVLFTLTFFSVILFVPLSLSYVALVLNGVFKGRAAKVAEPRVLEDRDAS